MLKRSRGRGLVVLSGILVFAGIGYLILHNSHAATNADINGDGKVDVLDLSVLASNYGQSGKTFSQGDITGDGIVNVFDFSLLASNWGSGSVTNNCTIYASPGGGGNGSSASSPTTLSSAISATVPGSVVCLMGGTYNHSSNIQGFRSGTSSSWITFRNYDSTPPLIKYTGGSLSGGQFQLAGSNNWNGPSYIIFDGLSFDGNNLIGGALFIKDGSHHITVKNCRIQNEGATGIAFNAVDYVRAENNLIFHGGYNQGWSSGISLWYGGDGGTNFGGSTPAYDSYAGFHNVIANNIISGWADNSTQFSDGNGLIVDGGGSGMPPALFIGNVIFENAGRGYENLANDGNVWLVNNTFYASGLDSRNYPNVMARKTTNNHWINNISYSKSGGYNYWVDTSTVAGQNSNIYYNGNNQSASSSLFYTGAAVNPLFIAPLSYSSAPNATAPWNLANSLTLQSGSPAINHGIDPKTATGMNSTLLEVLSQYLNKDVAGNSRYNGVIDIGAYEF